jgi:hypothetical protein
VRQLRARLGPMDVERRRYTLETLAGHLAAAGRHDRLGALFHDDGWLLARFEGSGYVYDDYLADLSLAWQGFAHPMALEQADRGEQPAAVVDAVRYALIRSSVNSVAGNYPPEIVARAVETGTWAAERGLSVAEHVADPGARAELFTRLLAGAALSDEQRDRARAGGLAAVRSVARSNDRTEALAGLAPHLGADFAGQALEVAETVDQEHLALALATAAALLEGERRRDVLERALRSTGSVMSFEAGAAWSAVAAALIPGVDDDLVRRAVGMVPPEGEERARALAALASRLPEPERTRLAGEAIAAVRTLGDDDRVVVLGELVGRLDGMPRREAAELALETALRLPPIDREDNSPQVVGLLAAAPFLAGVALDRAVEAAMDVREIGAIRTELVDLLVALAARLDGVRRRRVVETALELARMPRVEGTDEGPWEVQPLAAVVPLLEGAQRAEVLRAALDRALALLPLQRQNELVSPRGEALAMLAPLLSGELVEAANRSAAGVEDGETRALALAALGSKLTGAVRTEVLAAAVAALREIGAAGIRQGALERLVPLLADELLEPALDAAVTIDEELHRGDALAAVNPRLSGPLAARAFDAVAAIEFEPARAKALTALVANLPEELLDRAFAVARAIDWEPGRTQAVAAIAARLPTTRRRRMVTAALRSEADVCLHPSNTRSRVSGCRPSATCGASPGRPPTCPCSTRR